jgi:hypothetical protein
MKRLVLLLVTAGWTLFTVAFIPLHTRGVIQLDRQNIQKVTKPSCCCEGEAKINRVAASSSDTKKSEQPKPLRQGSCAVCFLIAQLSTPATMPILDSILDEIRTAVFILPTEPEHLFQADLYQSRAPPSRITSSKTS